MNAAGPKQRDDRTAKRPSEGREAAPSGLASFFRLSIDLLATASTRGGTWESVNPTFERALGATVVRYEKPVELRRNAEALFD